MKQPEAVGEDDALWPLQFGSGRPFIRPQLCEGVGVPVVDGTPPELEGDVDPLGLQLGSTRPFIKPQLCEGVGVPVADGL